MNEHKYKKYKKKYLDLINEYRIILPLLYQQEKLNDLNSRILLNSLIQNNIIKYSFDCNDNIISQGKMQPIISKSNSQQFTSINFTPLKNTLQLKPNTELSSKYWNKLNINKLRYSFFAKINIYFEQSKINRINRSNKYLDNERKIYQYISTLLKLNHTPNITSIIFHQFCDKESNISKLKIDNNSISNLYEKMYPNDTIKKYGILMLENIDNFVDLKHIIYNENKYTNEEILIIFIQIIYTLECFKQIGIVHNDLHFKNISIEKLEQPIVQIYIVNDKHSNIKKILKFTTKYFVRIFDFDRSYILPNNYSEIILQEIPFSGTYEARKNQRDYNTSKKFDLYYLCAFLSSITKRKSKLTPIINDILYQKSSIDRYEKYSPYNIRNTKEEIEKVKESLSSYQWLIKLSDKDYFISGNSLRINSNIGQIKFNGKEQLFYLPNMDNKKLIKELAITNWSKQSTESKIYICKSLITNDEIRNQIVKKN